MYEEEHSMKNRKSIFLPVCTFLFPTLTLLCNCYAMYISRNLTVSAPENLVCPVVFIISCLAVCILPFPATVTALCTAAAIGVSCFYFEYSFCCFPLILSLISIKTVSCRTKQEKFSCYSSMVILSASAICWIVWLNTKTDYIDTAAPRTKVMRFVILAFTLVYFAMFFISFRGKKYGRKNKEKQSDTLHNCYLLLGLGSIFGVIYAFSVSFDEQIAFLMLSRIVYLPAMLFAGESQLNNAVKIIGSKTGKFFGI